MIWIELYPDPTVGRGANIGQFRSQHSTLRLKLPTIAPIISQIDRQICKQLRLN